MDSEKTALPTDPEELMKLQLDFMIYSSTTTNYEDKQWYKPSTLGYDYPDDYVERTFTDFTSSNARTEELTHAFMAHYERPGIPHLDERKTSAKDWFDFIESR